MKNNALKLFYILISFLTFYLLYALNPQLSNEARVVLGILGMAGVLWVSEVIPLFVTSFVIAFSLIMFGGFSVKEVFNPFFDPIIVLFLGGFVLATAFSKYGLDKMLATKVLSFCNGSPTKIVFCLMFLSAFLSMWLSNTAATALLIPIGVSILKNSGIKSGGLYILIPLSIAYASTTGGLGTIIGSPPNALAVKFLGDEGITINFLDWMKLMIPFVIVFIFIIFGVLRVLYASHLKKLKVSKEIVKINTKGKVVLGITLLTIFLWLFGSKLGINSYTTAIIPIILFFGSGLLESQDIRKVNWETLLLFGGGLTLGEAVKSSGVDVFIAQGLSTMFSGMWLLMIYTSIILVAIAFTVVASNTGAAVLMIPIVIALSKSLGIDPTVLVLLTTVGVSMDFILPVGTPPSAIAYSTGYIKTVNMVKAGLILTIFVVLVGVSFGVLVW